MGFPMSEAHSLPMNAKSLVESVMTNLCGSHYPLFMAMVEAPSQRLLSLCDWHESRITCIGCCGRY